MRTQNEIIERLEAVMGGDILGFSTEVLIAYVDFDHVSKSSMQLKPDVTAAEWNEDVKPLDEESIRKEALDYLEFAYGKAVDHRGLSAGRSVEKMTEFIWILGGDCQKIEDAPYVNYGVPKLFAAAEALGVEPSTQPDLVRMSKGLPCRKGGCDDGCGF